MRRHIDWLAAALLGLSVVGAHAQQPQAPNDYVQEVASYLEQETGETPQAQDITDELNHLLAKAYQKGDYHTGLIIAEQAYLFAEQALGSEHPDTLTILNTLALLYQAQGRYGEAEPLFQRALAAGEQALGPAHPETLTIQLNYAMALVNLKQPERALGLLGRLEPRLLELAALRLRTTRQEWVRRDFLVSQSLFQDAVLSLAMAHPQGAFLELAAKVMLRWKQIQGEEESFLARLVRHRGEHDAQVGKVAQEIAALRRDLSHLMHHPEPDIDLQRWKLNELEAKETRLAQISRAFKRHLQVRGAHADDVRSYLPRAGGALLELRQYRPVDFKTGKLGSPRWAALLLPAIGEMTLRDLGPVAKTRVLWQTLRRSGDRATAAALYQNLFGQLDEQLKGYGMLYLAPDSFLNLVAFTRLVTPEGHYWVQRQALRQVRTGRHLIAGYDRDLAKPKGLLALGGVNYEGFGDSAPELPPESPAVPDSSMTVALRALSQEIGQFGTLEETGREAREVANTYWSYWNIAPQVWLGAEAAETRLKTLPAAPKVLHLATHGFYLSETRGEINRPMVLSGLALAGANRGLQGQRDPHGEDGILYALEVQDLNLEDTELVALSACDTGAGTLDYSEGVYGLVRAFRIAGARNVMMSLWALGDASAREFMVRFYRRWLDGSKPKDLAVALRETQLSFIEDEDKRLRNPKIWAPFVLVEAQ